MVERNMCNAVMRGIAVPPGSKSTSRATRVDNCASRATRTLPRERFSPVTPYGHFPVLSG
jgi:hypothetical protein